MKKEEFNKYLFYTTLILLIILSYFLVKEFIISLISAFILAYLMRPVYRRMYPKLGKSIASLTSVLIIILIIIIPLTFILSTLASQLSQSLTHENINSTINTALKLPILNKFNIDLGVISKSITPTLLSFAGSIFKQIPSFFLSILITLIATYYILKDWDHIVELLTNYIPFKNKKLIKDEMGSTTSNIIYGYLSISLLEFIIAAIGFYISGVKFFIFLPFIIAILAFFPAVGPLLVWAPLAFFHLLSGNYLTATGVIITGTIISMGIDNLLAPKVIGKRSKIHPLIMLIGVLGGISFFGILGFVIGPIILVYTIKIIQEALEQE